MRLTSLALSRVLLGAQTYASQSMGKLQGWGRTAHRDVNTVVGPLRAIAKGRFNYEF